MSAADTHAAGVEVSVVIPVGPKASIDQLVRQLESLAPQMSRINAEVIVSDNGRRLRADLLPAIESLRIVDSSSTPGPGHARNQGAAEARGAVLAFCDADDVASDDWLCELTRRASSGNVIGGGLDYVRLNGARRAQWNTQTTQALPIKFGYLEFAPSCNLAVAALVFAELGGFDESLLYGEDIDFCWRAQRQGHHLEFAPDAVMHYRMRTGPRNVWAQARRWGASDATLLKLHQAHGASRGLGGMVTELFSVAFAGLQAGCFPWAREKFAFRAGSLVGRVHGSLRERVWAV